jgi:hypothetical protein
VTSLSRHGAGLLLGTPAKPGTMFTLAVRTDLRTSEKFIGEVMHCRQFGDAWSAGFALAEPISDADIARLCGP